jgi:hypothetical protein
MSRKSKPDPASSPKKKYAVLIPLAGHILIRVEAEGEEEAKAAAWDELQDGAAHKPDAEIEWEFFEHLVEGNTCHANVTEVEVEEERD